MENTASNPREGPYPWLLLRESQVGQNQLIFVNDEMLRDTKHTVVSCGCDGWLLIVKNLDQCLLWNALTLESIQLPSLDYSEERIRFCFLLSSPPGNPKSLVIIFFEYGTSFMFCRVGDQLWTEEKIITDSVNDGDMNNIENPVCCRGKLYAIARIGGYFRLLVIDLNLPDGPLVIRLHERIPHYKHQSSGFFKYLVESCGEIFLIYVLRGGNQLEEVAGLEILKLDISFMEWTQVNSAKDRMFFLDDDVAYSYRVMNPEIEGYHIYHTEPDGCIYAYDVEENNVSVPLPCPDLEWPWGSPKWVMAPTCTGNDCSGLMERKLEISPQHIRDIVPYLQGDEEESKGTDYLSQLPLDLLSFIVSRLMVHDYINFRLLNRTCQLVAPLERIEELAMNLPWLMFCKKDEDKCKLTDPLQQVSYLMNNPSELNDVRMCCSKQGWCLMEKGEICDDNPNVFLWNPFTKEIISLPYSTRFGSTIIGGEILSSPDSSDCVVFLISDGFDHISFDYINVKRQTWEKRFSLARPTIPTDICTNNNPVFYKGDLCFLDSKGILFVFKPNDSIVEVKAPCDWFFQSFLLEANGKLLALFLGFMGEWLEVFELDLSKMEWVEAEDLGGKTLFVSYISSFAITATKEEMKNTIFFPRLCGNNIIYYSLSSKKYHCYGSESVMENFYNTKEQLYSGWIEPKC